MEAIRCMEDELRDLLVISHDTTFKELEEFGEMTFNDFVERVENKYSEDEEAEFYDILERVYDDKREVFADMAWEDLQYATPYDDDDERATDFLKWCEQGEFGSCFVADNGYKIYKIWEDGQGSDVINVMFADNKLYRY